MSQQFIPYCIGIVAEDKERDVKEVNVFPIEKMPYATGELTEIEETSGEVDDYSEEKHNYTLKRSNMLKAEWYPNGQYNRSTAPSVCKGEYVMLYKYLGEDRYFWMPLLTELRMRKKEQVINTYSNKRNIMEADDENLVARTYFSVIDTEAKLVHFHTDKNTEAKEEEDKEKAGYDVTLNGGEGFAQLQDTEENFIKLSSVEGHLDVKLNGNITLEMPSESPNGEEDKKGNISITQKGDMTIKTTGSTNITIEGDKGLKGKVSKNIELEFDKIKLSNGADELISLLLNLIDEIMNMQHMGNQGAPTMIHPASKAKITQLKTKFQKFKV